MPVQRDPRDPRVRIGKRRDVERILLGDVDGSLVSVGVDDVNESWFGTDDGRESGPMRDERGHQRIAIRASGVA
jgi:hypothetical protein